MFVLVCGCYGVLGGCWGGSMLFRVFNVLLWLLGCC